MDALVIEALIARLATAAEGSGELDELIWAALLHYGGRSTAMLGKVRQFGDLGFSRSVDAALTLLPEGWRDQGCLAWPGYDDGVYQTDARATIHHDISSGGGPCETGYAATLALALCIASLKARARDATPPVLPVRSE